MLVEVSTGVVALSTVQNVKRWVEEESQDKKKQPMDWSGWDSGGEGGLDKTMVHEDTKFCRAVPQPFLLQNISLQIAAAKELLASRA
jgi:hypothetical protein